MKRIVVLSDIHVGSKSAVSPLTFKMQDGSEYTANENQKMLYWAWYDLTQEWKNPDVLVINGEPIDGQDPKGRGVGQWTTNYEEQMRAAKQLIDMFHAKKVYLTSGSGYHVDANGITLEEQFGKMIGATRQHGQYAPYEFFLRVEGYVFHFAHHIQGSASGWSYRATPISKEAMLMRLSAPDFYKADVVVRSHNHYYSGVFGPSYVGVTTPAWKLQDAFAAKRGVGGTLPHIGGIRFNVEKLKPILQSIEVKTYPLKAWKPKIVRA